MYLGQVDEPPASDAVADAMAAFGIYCEEPVVIDDDEFWLWPENEAAFQLWLSLQSQWMVGMSGPTGLNYAGVEVCMRLRGTKKSEQRALFDSIQAMEQAALEAWAAQR